MTVGFLMAAAPAHAWYVDITITGGGTVSETTDANEIDEHCPDDIEGFRSPSNTPTGQVGAFCRAGDAAGDYGSGWVVRYVAEPAPGYRFDRWESDGRTSPGPVLCDGSNGSPTYSGTACQFQTWQNLQVRAVFIDDTAPTMAGLNGPSTQVNGPATFTFSAVSDPTYSHFECRVTTAGESVLEDWHSCTSGVQKNPGPSGQEATYKFYARAVDHSGNRSTPLSVSWVVDKLAPETMIDSGPVGAVKSTTATFNFSSSSVDVAGYRCFLDGVQSPCQSPMNYFGLAQGPHTFAVQALDDAGNYDGTPSTRTWTVDTVAPETSITDGPAEGSLATSDSASFSFSSNEAGTFECQLDGTGWAPCESPRAFTGLSEGSHTVAVRARDAAGNVDAEPATRSWTVDTVLPETTITSGPAAGSTSPSQAATFAFTASEAGTFECQLDGSAWAACESPRSYTGLAEGPHTFAVRATDTAGNVEASPATRSWTVDVPLATMAVNSKLRTKVSNGRTTIRKLHLTGLPAASTVKISCKNKSKGCAFKSKTLKPATSSATLTKLFKKRKLSAGAVITIAVSAPGYEPTTFRYKTRKGSKRPSGGKVARTTVERQDVSIRGWMTGLE